MRRIKGTTQKKPITLIKPGGAHGARRCLLKRIAKGAKGAGEVKWVAKKKLEKFKDSQENDTMHKSQNMLTKAKPYEEEQTQSSSQRAVLGTIHYSRSSHVLKRSWSAVKA